jgi:hypothetical protein
VSDLAEAKRYARMVRKFSPAVRMRGDALDHWREGRLRDVLDRHGLGHYYGDVRHMVVPSADERERKSNAARYRRAYGSSRDRGRRSRGPIAAVRDMMRDVARAVLPRRRRRGTRRRRY